MKENFYLILVIICWIISIGSFITSITFQIILSIQKFGVIFGNNSIIIPHWSLSFIAGGVIFGILGYILGEKL